MERALGEWRGHGDDVHAGGDARPHEHDGVFENQAFGGLDAQAFGGEEVDLRVGLRFADVLAGEDGVEMAKQIQRAQNVLGLRALGHRS